MKVIPSVVYRFKSKAEEKLYKLLKEMKSEPGSIALHSQNLAEHDYKEWCEIDYILIMAKGIFVVEVKGGRISRGKDGLWRYRDKYNVVHTRSEGPFDQAQSGKYALKNALIKEFGDQEMKNVSIGWGCIFPDTVNIPQSEEVSKETIIDAKDCDTPEKLLKAINKAMDYWFNKKYYYKEIDSEKIRKMHMGLRPVFEITPSISVRVNEIFNQLVCLTDRQYHIIDAADECSRILCTGGAGSGKSVVALEIARREALKDKRVAFISSGRFFCEYIKKSFVHTGIDFLQADTDAGKLIGVSGVLYDCLVVDEAQDLMNIQTIEVMGDILKNGFEEGNWYLFLDPNNQKGLLGKFEDDAYEYVRELSDHSVKFKQNCRNTPQIIVQTQLMTGADIGVSMFDGQGEKVIIRKYSNYAEGANLFDKQIKSWQNEDVDLRDITILYVADISDTFIAVLKGTIATKIYPLSSKTVNLRPINKLATCNILDFKGLESKYIMVVGLENLNEDPGYIRILYTGITRANAVLWLAVPEAKQALIDKMRLENYKSRDPL